MHQNPQGHILGQKNRTCISHTMKWSQLVNTMIGMCVYIFLPTVVIVHVCGLALQIIHVSNPSSTPDPYLHTN